MLLLPSQFWLVILDFLFAFSEIPLCTLRQEDDLLPALSKWVVTHEARARGDLAALEVGTRSGPDAENQRVNTSCTLLRVR